MPTTDGRRRTSDKSAIEKLRCLPAGGAKNMMYLSPGSVVSYAEGHQNIPRNWEGSMHTHKHTERPIS